MLFTVQHGSDKQVPPTKSVEGDICRGLDHCDMMGLFVISVQKTSLKDTSMAW